MLTYLRICTKPQKKPHIGKSDLLYPMERLLDIDSGQFVRATAGTDRRSIQQDIDVPPGLSCKSVDANIGMQKIPYHYKVFILAPVGKKTIIADLTKTSGKNMQHESPDELISGESRLFDLFVPVVFVGESHVGVSDVNDP